MYHKITVIEVLQYLPLYSYFITSYYYYFFKFDGLDEKHDIFLIGERAPLRDF